MDADSSKEMDVLIQEITNEIQFTKKKSFDQGVKHGLETALKAAGGGLKENGGMQRTEMQETVLDKLEQITALQKKIEEKASQMLENAEYASGIKKEVSEISERLSALETRAANEPNELNQEQVKKMREELENHLRAFNENLIELTTQVSDLRNKITKYEPEDMEEASEDETLDAGAEEEEEEEKPRKSRR